MAKVRKQTLPGTSGRVVCITCFLIDEEVADPIHLKAARKHVRETGHEVHYEELQIISLTRIEE